MPIITLLGLLIFSSAPLIGAEITVAGLIIGTVIFSVAGGLGEVLTSPIIAALPSDNPEREMSKLHSAYAFGVVGVIPFSTLFLLLVGKERWWLLIAVLSLVPLVSSILFFLAKLPEVRMAEGESGAIGVIRDRGVWLFVLAIFLGGAAECTMSQWASGYLELSLGIPKVVGDLAGVSMFALMLGLGRLLFARYGRNIGKVIFVGSICSFVCYIVAALSPVPIIGLVGCALTGLATSMFWPGSLMAATEKYESGGVIIFALMAAGGDLGASVGPQLVGIVTDVLSGSSAVMSFAAERGLSREGVSMRVGMIIGSLFSLAAIPTYCLVRRSRLREGREK